MVPRLKVAIKYVQTKVNDIRPGADPVNERIKSQIVTKHGPDFKSKVVGRAQYLVLYDPNHSMVNNLIGM